MTETRVFRHSPRIVARLVGGDRILVPLASRGAEIDSIFNLNATGSFLWDAIDGARSVSELALGLCREFEVDEEKALEDCLRFLSQLESIRAIEPVPSGRPS